jgi:hypothetical protein
LTEKFFDQARREQIVGTVNRVETLPDVSELADLLR